MGIFAIGIEHVLDVAILRRGFFRERPWQHKLGREHRAGFLDQPIQRGRHPGDGPMGGLALDVRDPNQRRLRSSVTGAMFHVQRANALTGAR
jgi:hypothetical protein